MSTFLKLTNSEDLCQIEQSDVEKAFVHKWFKLQIGYAATLINKKQVLLHRYLLNLNPEDMAKIDHINGNRLDNRRSNLRQCSQMQNLWNKGRYKNNMSGYKGVSRNKNKKKNRFSAFVCSGYKNNFLGSFETPEEAAAAYDKAALRLHGEFARLNFPQAAA